MKYKRNTFRVKPSKDQSRFPLMETKLIEWITESRLKGACIGGMAIQQMSRVLYKVFFFNYRCLKAYI